MGTIYHFGDSYATTGGCDIHYVNEMANRLNFNYSALGTIPGGSNEQILSRFLAQILEFKIGDMIFFNFSFFTRGCYYNREAGEIVSTNSIYNGDSIDCTEDYVRDIITYQVDYNEDYNRRLFHLYDILIKQLVDRGVPVYYIFIEECEFSPALLGNGIEVSFPSGFYNWLKGNGYHKEQCCHYTAGIQGVICDYVMDNTGLGKKRLL